MKRIFILSILAIVAFGGMILVYFPYLDFAWSRSPWGDTIHLTGPLFCEISRQVKDGAMPLMNWSTFEALDYNPHVAIYYPFYFFGLLDFCSPSAAAQAADIILVFHAGIFALTMSSLIRSTGIPLLVALCAGAVAAIIPNVTTLGDFPTFIAAAAWLPMAIEGLVRLYYRKQYALGALLLALGTSAMLTAGPGTNMLSALVFIGLGASIHTAIRIYLARDFASAKKLLLAVVAAASVTIVLSLASTVNLFLHLREIIRWTRTGAVVGHAGPANLSEILTEKLGWTDLPQLIVPLNTGYAAGYYFLGPVLILLAVAGAVLGWKRPVVRLFSMLACACVLLVFLLPGFVVLAWTLIPGLSHTRHLSLVATPLAISVAVLTAHGIHALLFQAVAEQQRKILFAVSSVLLAATFAAVGLIQPLRFFASSDVATGALLISIAIMAVALAIRCSVVRQLAVVIALGFTSVVIYKSTPYSDGVPAATKTALWQSLTQALDRIKATDPNPGRIAIEKSVGAGDLTYMNSGSIATYAGLSTFTHYTSPRIFWKFEHEISLIQNNDYGRYGGKYLLTSEAVSPVVGREVSRDGGIATILLNERRPMISTICSLPEGLSLSAEPKKRKNSGQLEFLRADQAAIVEGFADGHGDCPSVTSVSSVQTDRLTNSLNFSLSDGPKRLLVISLPPYSSWTLSVGGEAIPLYNLSSRQIVALLPEHASGPAQLIYSPTAFEWRLRISILGWMLAILAFGVLLVGQRRKPSGAACPA